MFELYMLHVLHAYDFDATHQPTKLRILLFPALPCFAPPLPALPCPTLLHRHPTQILDFTLPLLILNYLTALYHMPYICYIANLHHTYRIPNSLKHHQNIDKRSWH